MLFGADVSIACGHVAPGMVTQASTRGCCRFSPCLITPNWWRRTCQETGNWHFHFPGDYAPLQVCHHSELFSFLTSYDFLQAETHLLHFPESITRLSADFDRRCWAMTFLWLSPCLLLSPPLHRSPLPSLLPTLLPVTFLMFQRLFTHVKV